MESAASAAYRHGACWQSQRSSILSPACLQWSLQYFPYWPFGSTMHWQAGCAHLAAPAITTSAPTLRPAQIEVQGRLFSGW